MNHKEEYRRLVIIAKSKLLKAGKPHRMEDIAKQLGYSRPYFSKLTGESGNPSSDHVMHLKETFPFLSNAVQTSVLDEPGYSYSSDHQKYVQLLEKTNAALLSSIQLSLNSVLENQQLLRATTSTDLNQSAKIRAKLEGKPLSKVQDEINRELSDSVRASLRSDTRADTQGKG